MSLLPPAMPFFADAMPAAFPLMPGLLPFMSPSTLMPLSLIAESMPRRYGRFSRYVDDARQLMMTIRRYAAALMPTPDVFFRRCRAPPPFAVVGCRCRPPALTSMLTPTPPRDATLDVCRYATLPPPMPPARAPPMPPTPSSPFFSSMPAAAADADISLRCRRRLITLPPPCPRPYTYHLTSYISACPPCRE